jgi:hypothetical protein
LDARDCSLFRVSLGLKPGGAAAGIQDTVGGELACLLRLRRRPSPSPPSSCLAACSRTRCHAGRVTGLGPGRPPPSPPPPPLVAHAAGPGATRAGPRWLRRGSGVLTFAADPSQRDPSLLRSLGRLAGAASRSAGSPPHSAAGTRRQSSRVSWGCAAETDTAGCGSPGASTAVWVRALRRARAACHGCRSGPTAGAPERHCAAQPGTGASRREPRNGAQVGRGCRLRIAVG